MNTLKTSMFWSSKSQLHGQKAFKNYKSVLPFFIYSSQGLIHYLIPNFFHSLFMNVHSLVTNVHSLVMNFHSLVMNVHSWQVNIQSPAMNIHSIVTNVFHLSLTSNHLSWMSIHHSWMPIHLSWTPIYQSWISIHLWFTKIQNSIVTSSIESFDRYRIRVKPIHKLLFRPCKNCRNQDILFVGATRK